MKKLEYHVKELPIDLKFALLYCGVLFIYFSMRIVFLIQ